MRKLSPKQGSSPGSDYATHADFCRVFGSEIQRLYLLAYLLTANHEAAEKCFLLTVEESFEQKNVFKGWVHSWVKHTLVKNAIHMMFPESPGMGRPPERVLTGQHGPLEDLIDGVIRLTLLDRFVFVLSALERYSTQQCSVLLQCTAGQVLRARAAATNQLALRFHPASREQQDTVFPARVLPLKPAADLNEALTELLVASETRGVSDRPQT